MDARASRRSPRPWRGRAMPASRSTRARWSRPRRARSGSCRSRSGRPTGWSLGSRATSSRCRAAGTRRSICGAMSAGRPAGMTAIGAFVPEQPAGPRSTSPARSPARSRPATRIPPGHRGRGSCGSTRGVPRALGVRRAGGHRPLLDRRRRRRAGRRRVRAAVRRPGRRRGVGRAVRRPRAGRDRRRCPSCGRRRSSLGRAHQALHHDRDRVRPGPDLRRHRVRRRGGAARVADRARPA